MVAIRALMFGVALAGLNFCRLWAVASLSSTGRLADIVSGWVPSALQLGLDSLLLFALVIFLFGSARRPRGILLLPTIRELIWISVAIAPGVVYRITITAFTYERCTPALPSQSWFWLYVVNVMLVSVALEECAFRSIFQLRVIGISRPAVWHLTAGGLLFLSHLYLDMLSIITLGWMFVFASLAFRERGAFLAGATPHIIHNAGWLIDYAFDAPT